jgi:hypothetical protein
METFRTQRQQSIDRLSSEKNESFAELAMGLWERVATPIIALVGEAGFDSLYARSVFLAQSTFPWLTEPTQAPPDGQRFAKLRADLEGQPFELASDANRLLLIIFTDTLASLIGDHLTERVLAAAWGNFDPDRADKRENNDQHS